MVSWFHPVEIARTAFHAMFAQLITGYLDRREIQAALPTKPGPVDVSFANRDEVWIDYVADIGDGWDATYTTAMLLGRRELTVKGCEHPLPRAQILVFGGDCVYPTPSRENYRRRLTRPYEAALTLPPGTERPILLAIPGNHDWYDGLTHFLRLFCQPHDIGAWRTVQQRSYFAVELPGGWALWGNDVQLDTRIDTSQLQYFDDAADHLGKRRDGAGTRVILCTAKPSWLGSEDKKRDAYHNLWFFEYRYQADKHHCPIRVTIAGDQHCYGRYANSAGGQKIIAGGGGAYLMGSHRLPGRVEQPSPEDLELQPLAEDVNDRPPYLLSAWTHPSARESRRLALGVLRFPLLPKNWLLCLVLGVLYAWFVWTLRPPQAGPTLGDQLRALVRRFAGLEPDAGRLESVLAQLPKAWAASPLSLLLPLALIAAGAAFCRLSVRTKPWWPKWAWGALHGTAHLVLALAVAWGLAVVGTSLVEPSVFSWNWRHLVAFCTSFVVIGGLAGGLLMGLYLAVSDRWLGWHSNEAFAAQAIPHYRSFLRMRVDKGGRLTIYPIGVRRVAQRWRRPPEWEPGEALYEPVDEVPEPFLIEGPIEVR